MKNLKKISREQLRKIQGGDTPPQCRVGYIYICNAVGACIPEADMYDCVCGCVPRVRP